jgi:hypothetical protein
MGQQGYAHGWINCNLAIPANAKTLCFYAKTSGAANNLHFNVILYCTDKNGATFTYDYKSAAGTSEDVPVGEYSWIVPMSNMPAGSTINTIHYYISGGMNYSITYEELGIIASFKENDTTLSAKSGSFFRMPGYTVVLVEHMGGGSNRFFVDAVIDGEEYSDEAIHQLLPRMQNGFVLYVPDDAWTNGIPSHGDIVTAGWRNNADVFSYDRTADSAVSWPSVNRSNTPFANPYEICFYRNPAEDAQGNAVVRPLGADAVNAVADVNATVQMFNYGANVNAEGNPLSF